MPLRLPGLSVDLVSDSGVFSGGQVDPGTMVLLHKAPDPPPTGDILDLGCGYGPIAIALALRSPGARIWGVDVNQRALELLARNAAASGARNVSATRPEDVPAEVRFAALYSNPPVRIGKERLHLLLTTWLERLEAGGRAWLVVQKHLGSDSLARWLAGEGFPTRRIASRRAYRLLEVAERT